MREREKRANLVDLDKDHYIKGYVKRLHEKVHEKVT